MPLCSLKLQRSQSGLKCSDSKDDEEGWQHHAEGGEEGSPEAGGAIADKGGGVDRDGTGCGFGDGEDLQGVVVGDPALLFHRFSLYI